MLSISEFVSIKCSFFYNNNLQVVCNPNWHDCYGSGSVQFTTEDTSGASHGGVGGMGEMTTVESNRLRRPHGKINDPLVWNVLLLIRQISNFMKKKGFLF